MATFDQYLAESGRQSELDNLRRSGQYDAAKSAYERGGSFGTSPNGFSSVLDSVKSSITGALQPVIDKIQGQSPAITQAYSGARTTLQNQKTSLNDRYQKLLQDIRNTGKKQVDSATKTTNTELARRGVSGDSTLAQQEIQNTVNPIEDTTTAQINQANAAQSGDEANLANAIAQLAIGEQGAQGNILSQVAQLLSGGINQSVGLAGNLYSNQIASENARYQTPEQQLYSQLQNQALQQQIGQNQQLAPLQLQQLEAQIAKLKKSGNTLSDEQLDTLW